MALANVNHSLLERTTTTDDGLKVIETLLATYHEEVWEAAEKGGVDYDYAGRETAKKIIALFQSSFTSLSDAQIQDFFLKMHASIPKGEFLMPHIANTFRAWLAANVHDSGDAKYQYILNHCDLTWKRAGAGEVMWQFYVEMPEPDVSAENLTETSVREELTRAIEAILAEKEST